MNQYRLGVVPVWESGSLELKIGKREDSKRFYATSITFEEIRRGEMIPSLLNMQPEEAQELMDALFAAGVRPSREFGQSSQIESIKFHLEDMRKLVFSERN